VSAFREAFARARDAGDWQACMAAIPYANWLGLRAVTVDNEVLVQLAYDDRNIGNPSLPALHGGVMGALLEMCALFEILYRAESTLIPKMITFTVDYVRPARAIDTFARATIVRHGRRIATVRAEAWQDDRTKPVAIATAHMLVLPAES